MNSVFLGIFPPDLWSVLLPILLAGIIGSLLCYAHRFLAFIVLPAFVFWCIYQINFLEIFVSLLSSYMLIVYSTMLLFLIAMSIATLLTWKKHKNSSKLEQ
jgi:hypothetical protein